MDTRAYRAQMAQQTHTVTDAWQTKVAVCQIEFMHQANHTSR